MAVSSWVGVVVIGFLAGLLARLISSRPGDPKGCLMTTLLGVFGAILFSWLGQQLGLYAEGEKAGFIGAVVGALIVLALWRLIADRTR